MVLVIMGPNPNPNSNPNPNPNPSQLVTGCVMMGGGFGAPGLGAVVGGLGTCLLLLALLNTAGLSVPLATRTRALARTLPPTSDPSPNPYEP